MAKQKLTATGRALVLGDDLAKAVKALAPDATWEKASSSVMQPWAWMLAWRGERLRVAVAVGGATHDNSQGNGRLFVLVDGEVWRGTRLDPKEIAAGVISLLEIRSETRSKRTEADRKAMEFAEELKALRREYGIDPTGDAITVRAERGEVVVTARGSLAYARKVLEAIRRVGGE